MNTVYQYFVTLPPWEVLAVVMALAYVVLAARESIWCWPAAIVSTIVYTVIFYDVYLWMDGLLQVYYLLMAVYGWYYWQQINNDNKYNHENNNTLPIQSWPVSLHIKIISGLAVISVAVGWLMANYTPTDFPYLDSATTVFAVFSTYLVVKKVLENWLYWVVIDAVSIYIYIEKSLEPTAFLFVLYVFMAVYGYIKWLASYQQQTPSHRSSVISENPTN